LEGGAPATPGAPTGGASTKTVADPIVTSGNGNGSVVGLAIVIAVLTMAMGGVGLRNRS